VSPSQKKTVTFRGELGAQLFEIVDATVEDDSEAKLRIYHGLMRGRRQVDDA